MITLSIIKKFVLL